MSLVSAINGACLTRDVFFYIFQKIQICKQTVRYISLSFFRFAGFIDFIGFMSYIPFFAKLIRTILDHPLTIAELERARERVTQHDVTFKPKKKAKEPKSWEVF